MHHATAPIVFFAYAHADQELRDRLEAHLAALRRQGLVATWHDRKILAGQAFADVIDDAINRAAVILLLLSSDFIASDYCYGIEAARALERHDAGEAHAVPVILRHCDWESTPFGKLKAVPRDGKPVRTWPDMDEAFLDVAREVRRLVEALPGKKAVRLPPSASPSKRRAAERAREAARSSNLRVARAFSDRDKDKFLHGTFETVAAYFEESLAELEARNNIIETTFRRLDSNRFTAVAYRHGTAVSRCTISLSSGGHFGNGIHYSRDEHGGYTEWLSVEADDYSIFLRPLMQLTGSREQKLSERAAADLLWDRFMEPLQQASYR